MANIKEVGKVVIEFLMEVLNVKEVRVIKAEKVSDGFQIEAEVYEDSSFIKSLGLPTRVQDRNVYTVKLNKELEVESYGQQKSQSQTE